MKLPSCLLCDTVQLTEGEQLLILNSAADPFVQHVAERYRTIQLTLAEDNIALAQALLSQPDTRIRHIAFHHAILQQPAGTVDSAVMNLLYQPGKSWILYGLQVAAHALRPGGRLYVVGAKDRGLLTVAKHMQEVFGTVETLEISKGQRVICSRQPTIAIHSETIAQPTLPVFADSKLDEGTRLLLEALAVHATDETLDIGCGAGPIGLHIARQAMQGHVTMVDVSLAAVAAAQQATYESGLSNVRILPSDGVQAVIGQRFDLVVTNPPFHQGGLQTTAIAERFIGEAAQVLQPQGRFYLVANRFLKYEPICYACFDHVKEVNGNTRYKVLRAVGIHKRLPAIDR